MDTQTVMSLDNEYIMHTYGRLPLVPDHGTGAMGRNTSISQAVSA